MNKFKAVIFDMDGLMFDTETLFSAVQTKLLRKRGKTFTLELQNKMMGRKPVDAIKVMLAELGMDEDPLAVAKERDDEYLKLLKTDSRPMPGLFNLLKFLTEGQFKKAIASGSYHLWINTLVDKFNIRKEFDAIVSGEDVTVAKPAPDIYLLAVSKLGVRPDECLVLEDAVNGIRAAKAAGCYAVAVPSEFTKHQDFSEADLVISSLSDPKLLGIFAA
ncbi:MAG TPA: HAD family phosphatase [Candidatus Paceibacterota bacterium]|nr:HAD family phosphatase [Candidatus Paceibacterota bacterium]